MKLALNERTTERVHDLLRYFPEGTKLTHIINVALTELHSKLVPTIEDKTNEKSSKAKESNFNLSTTG